MKKLIPFRMMKISDYEYKSQYYLIHSILQHFAIVHDVLYYNCYICFKDLRTLIAITDNLRDAKHACRRYYTNYFRSAQHDNTIHFNTFKS